MVVPVQYPYELWYLDTPDSGEKDSKGNYPNVGLGNWVKAGMCRDEAKSKSRRSAVADGDVVEYDTEIFAPLDIPALADGTRIQVREGSFHRVDSTVRRSRRAMFNVTIWAD